jgi:hypothetical protein
MRLDACLHTVTLTRSFFDNNTTTRVGRGGGFIQSKTVNEVDAERDRATPERRRRRELPIKLSAVVWPRRGMQCRKRSEKRPLAKNGILFTDIRKNPNKKIEKIESFP